jgi:hypothetical protein
LLGRGFAELTEHATFRWVRLAIRDTTIEPGGLFFVVPTVEAVAHGRGRRRSALATVIVVIFVLIFVPIVILVFVLVVPVFVVVFIFIVLIGPTFGLVDEIEIEFAPLLEIEFFDFTVEIFDFDDLGILVDGEHAKRFLVFDVFVPLTFDGFVISAHGIYLDTGPSGLREGFYCESAL